MTDTTVDVRALTLSYRRLVLWFGGQLVLNLGSFALPLFAPGRAIAALFGLVFAAAMLTTIGALAYFGFRTAKALGSRVAWLWAIAMFVPCANVISLLALSSKATQACATRGIPVGLFGPKVPSGESAQHAG